MALSPAANRSNMSVVQSPTFGSGASPSPNRLDQWKNGTTPPWKDTFKVRCMNRMRTSRERFLNRMRKIDDTGTENCENDAPLPGAAAKVMEIEFDKMRREQKWNKDQEVTAYQQITEDVQSEIERAEQAYAEEMLCMQEEALNAQIDAYESAQTPPSSSSLIPGPMDDRMDDGSVSVGGFSITAEDYNISPQIVQCPSCFHQSLTIRHENSGRITPVPAIVCLHPECGLTAVPQDKSMCNLDYVCSALCDTVNEHATAQKLDSAGGRRQPTCSNPHLNYYTKSFFTYGQYQHLIAQCPDCSYQKVVF